MAKMKKGGLGKGLEALFADNASEDSQVTRLPLSEIEPNREQPRREFDGEALGELAASIAEHGVLQPIVVRPMVNGRYQIVAGERRWRASRLAGLSEIPVVVRELGERETMELALIENLQREDLNPLEEAQGLQALVENYGLTQEQVAARMGRSRSSIANSLRLLGLPEPVRQMVGAGVLSAGHARALLALPEGERLETAKRVAQEGLTVRQVEKLARKAGRKPAAPAAGREETMDSFYREAQLALESELHRRVSIQHKQDKGTLTLEFYSREELVDMMERLAGRVGETLY